MSAITLEHPVKTFDDRVLLPAGATLSFETLGALGSSPGAGPHEALPMLEYGSVGVDLVNLLGVPPYMRIFPDRQFVDAVMSEMEGVRLPAPVLQTLDYFKKHDFYTYRHILMVFALSTLLARDLISDRQDRVRLIATGPIHDIGKICVPLEVLKKTTPLTHAELSLMQHHTVAGLVLLSYYFGDAETLASRVARDHHERKDGSGYPRGILLDDPMVEIIAACDVYDALIAPRPYRPVSYENRAALEEMTDMAGRGAIGWDVLKALVSHNRKAMGDRYCESMFSSEKRGTPPPGNVHGMIADEDDAVGG